MHGNSYQMFRISQPIFFYLRVVWQIGRDFGHKYDVKGPKASSGRPQKAVEGMKSA